MTSVTTAGDVRAGQSVILAAQLVIVWIWVVKIVKVVDSPDAAEVPLY
jgi:hypothetical protein